MAMDVEGSRRVIDGSEVTRRRLRLNMTVEQLADEADVRRATLADFEQGKRQPRDVTVAKVEQALDRLEDEAGIGAPAPAKGRSSGELIEIRAQGVYGIDSIIVGGPVEDRDELVETIAKLIERVRRGERGNDSDA